MTKEEVLKAALELETKENLLSGDIWVGIEDERYPNGLFVQFEAKELENGNFSNDIFCIYGYENKLLNGEIETDYSNTLISFEFDKQELEQLNDNKVLTHSEFLENELKQNLELNKHSDEIIKSGNENFDKLNALYDEQNVKYKAILDIKTDLEIYVNSITDDIKKIDNEEFLTSTDLVELEVLQNVKYALNNILNKNSKNTQALDEIKELMNSSQNKDEKVQETNNQVNTRRNK